jgi:proteasome lid subunit RPN8/RPN11
MIEIPKTVVRMMEAHGREAFPEEGCGFLIGSAEGSRQVVEMRRAKNVAAQDRRRRYRIDPLELLHADNDARKEGLDLIGIYHSHPNHPAAPSEYDRSHAASWYTYVILSVQEREPRELTAWRFVDPERRFEPEEIRILSDRPGPRRPPRGREGAPAPRRSEP